MNSSSQPVTQAQLLDILDLLTKRIEDIFTDGMILNEADDGQIAALKNKIERRQGDIRSIRKLISRLRTQQAKQREPRRNRRKIPSEH